MLTKTIVILLISTISAQFVEVPEDGKLDFRGIAVKYAGAVEEHDVTTTDGYILKLFRIPGDETKPVLLVHGLACSSDDFIVRGNDSIAITLSRADYDVWLLNYRGNTHSRRHLTLNPDTDRSFWKFGPHQHGYYDLASSIDFVLNKTGERTMSLIGHSEGTKITYVLGSERPEYNDKIKVFIALAPVFSSHHVKTKLSKINEIESALIEIAKYYRNEELLAYDNFSGKSLRYFCGQSTIGIDVCRYLILVLIGFDPEALEPEFVPVLFAHFPAGTSRMNLEHDLQDKVLRRFAKFDYGPVKNLMLYGSKAVPDYDLKKVTMRTYLIAAANDNLSILQDVDYQARVLPNVEEYVIIENKKFNHLDYMWAPRFRVMEVHNKILEILRKYN